MSYSKFRLAGAKPYAKINQQTSNLDAVSAQPRNDFQHPDWRTIDISLFDWPGSEAVQIKHLTSHNARLMADVILDACDRAEACTIRTRNITVYPLRYYLRMLNSTEGIIPLYAKFRIVSDEVERFVDFNEPPGAACEILEDVAEGHGWAWLQFAFRMSDREHDPFLYRHIASIGTPPKPEGEMMLTNTVIRQN